MQKFYLEYTFLALWVKRYSCICGVGNPLISHQDYQSGFLLASAAVSLDGGSWLLIQVDKTKNLLVA